MLFCGTLHSNDIPHLFSFAIHIFFFFSQLFVRPPQTAILPFCMCFSWGSVRGHSALRDPMCYFLLLCAVSQGLSISYQFLERAELHAVLRTEKLLGFTSVTPPFSDLLLKGNLFCYIPLTQDMECFLAL